MNQIRLALALALALTVGCEAPGKPPAEIIETPIFSPAPGAYSSPVHVAIDCAGYRVEIHYTTDGTEPTESSPIYSSRIAVSATTTLRARGWKPGWEPSDEASASYVIAVATPTFSPPPGRYTSETQVTILCATPEAVIRYTTDGTEPTESSPVYKYPITIRAITALRAKSWKPGWTPSQVAPGDYTIAVATPRFSPGSGSFTSEVPVTILCATSDATIRYTTDGTEPTESSPVYPSPDYSIMVSGATMLQARGWRSGWAPSEIISGTYALTVIPPTLFPPPGTYTTPVKVSLACPTSGAAIHYTTDGTEPTEMSPTYTSPFTISDTVTLRAKAWRPGWVASTAWGSYTITDVVATPVFSPLPGTYPYPVNVSITCATLTATIHYTTDGTEPTPSSRTYTSWIRISANTTLKAKAWLSTWEPSGVASGDYIIDRSAAPPTPSP